MKTFLLLLSAVATSVALPTDLFPPDETTSIKATLLDLSPHLRTGEFREQAQVVYFLPKHYPFHILPGAIVRRHGAPADLRDFSSGDHVHINMVSDKHGNTHWIWEMRDQMSTDLEENAHWIVQSLSLEEGGKLTIARVTSEGMEPPLDVVADVRSRLWKGGGLGCLDDLAVNRKVFVNFAPGTARAPIPRHLLAEIWLDDRSRELATRRQEGIARFEIQRRGLIARVDEVDNHKPTLTVTLADPGLPGLLDCFKPGNTCKLAVTDKSLRTFEPVGGQGEQDAISGTILSREELPPAPGSSGIRVVIKPEHLLEGFRPGLWIRLVSQNTGFDLLPPEQRGDI